MASNQNKDADTSTKCDNCEVDVCRVEEEACKYLSETAKALTTLFMYRYKIPLVDASLHVSQAMFSVAAEQVGSLMGNPSDRDERIDEILDGVRDEIIEVCEATDPSVPTPNVPSIGDC